jgi:hypothetical protein
MTYKTIFEINSGSKDENGRINQQKSYETHHFSSRDTLNAMSLIASMAEYYAKNNPINPISGKNVVKVVQLHGPTGNIDQKSTGISGYFEENCLTITYSRLEKFLDDSKN